MSLHPRLWIAVTAWLLFASLLPASARGEATPSSNKLQLYVMPDTQSWAWNQDGTTLATWTAVAKELCRQRHRFVMVLHTGDLVDDPKHPYEWSNALSVMQLLDACEMPYAIPFGNHDFDNYPPPKDPLALHGDQNWTALVAKLAHKPAETAPSGKTALHALAKGWFVLSLDYRVSAADLAWIAAEIGERRGSKFLLLHHYCVKASGVSYEWCKQLFEQHPEIRIGVSGHWLGSTRDGWKQVARANGRKLITLFQNYQHVPSLAAWGVVVELDPGSGDLCVWSENLLTGAVTHPAAFSNAVGEVAAGVGRRCFSGS
ncbi:MAG: metallophosphoesterase family protein [Myxococcota bacterium]